jgi:hypothetical protein
MNHYCERMFEYVAEILVMPEADIFFTDYFDDHWYRRCYNGALAAKGFLTFLTALGALTILVDLL